MINFGIKLRQLRESKELTQQQLADILEVKPNTISSYETSASLPSVEKLIDICNYFFVSADYLMGLSGEQNLQLNKLTDEQNMAVSEIIRQYILVNEQLNDGHRKRGE